MTKFQKIAADLKTSLRGATVSVNVKSSDLAIIKVEFINDWARQFRVSGSEVTEL